jgi:gliding motility-associated-like protein
MRQHLVFFIFLVNINLFSQNLIVDGEFSLMDPHSGHNHGTVTNPCTAGSHEGCPCLSFWQGSFGYFNYCLSNGTLPARTFLTPGLNVIPHPYIGDGLISHRFLNGFHKDSLHIDNSSFRTLGFSLHQFLNSALDKDSNYVVEFYVMPNNRRPFNNISMGTLSIGNFSVYFHNQNTFDLTMRFNEITPNGVRVGDPVPIDEWTRILIPFTATGEEKIMFLGRHDSTINDFFIFDSSAVSTQGGFHRAVMFIDAVALYKASDTLFSVSIGNDTLLCPGEELSLTANLDDGFKLEDSVTTFLWSTGDTVPQITVNSPGTYWVEVTINHRFKQRDSIVVEYEEPIVWHAPFGESETIEKCYEVLPWVVSGPETSHDALYLWSTGENTQSIEIRHEDVYRLRIITPCFDEEGEFYFKPIDCNVDSSAFRGNIYIPSAFTPQGRNPLWIIGGIPPNTRVEVYSRWGQRIFYSEDYLHNWWDGTINGEPVPPGSYTYRIVAPFEGQDPVDKTGTVTIVR